MSLLAGAWLSVTGVSLAEPVRYEMESAAEFEADGWFQNVASTPQTFADSLMTVADEGYNEWILYNDPESPTRWWNYVQADKGWWIEARLQVIAGPDTASCFDGGPGIWIHDGRTLLKFTFTETEARISYPPPANPIAMDTTDDFHVYRVQNLGGTHFQVLVDGEMQLDVTTVAGGGGTEGITIGDLGGCGASHTVWDYLAYDTAAPGTEDSDDDGDGIEAAVDLCPDVADLEQVDSDSDRLGDACDACPNDPQNDFDQDGLCADEDICPNSPDNVDSNGNGLCDNEECLGYGVPGAAIAVFCPPGCDCAGGPPYGLPVPTAGTGGTAQGGSAQGGNDAGGSNNLGGASNGSGGATSIAGNRSSSDPDDEPNDVASNGTNSEANSDGAGCALSPRREEGMSLLAMLLGVTLLRRRQRPRTR